MFTSQPVSINPLVAGGSLAVSLVIGVAAGVYPPPAPPSSHRSTHCARPDARNALIHEGLLAGDGEVGAGGGRETGPGVRLILMADGVWGPR